jgi:hypothetical protein
MPPTPTTDYTQFLSVLGSLSDLIVLSIMIERGLAFIFEHEWFKCFGSQQIENPTNPGTTLTVSKAPAWKGSITLGISILICHHYQFDVLSTLFAKGADGVGMTLTGFVAAGGSAGAISIFQGYLNFDKHSRDALIAAKKADADAIKLTAELNVKNLLANKAKADAEIAQDTTAKAQAELQ